MAKLLLLPPTRTLHHDWLWSNRQRRQIEIPFAAEESFALAAAAIAELPGVQEVESARDSLQVRAKVKRFAPYSGSEAPLPWLERFRTRRNQIMMTRMPNGEASSVT